ncbi:hypothetical protein OE88DRAFT_1803274 [Heliocybe sulcata]|uniref:F-box domain-containing protein n=1 Tax=Heliocybe sulcata TaxID=5364 RepID=A0A5C3NIE8_9AGAM|nr:hypothetical protein OE88DRAFT_1803274 [Heliocybe sulcata]
MYSEDDEPHREDEYASRWPSRPYLKLYEKEEANARRRYLERDPEGQPDLRIWHALRFLGVIKGFHTGTLDLIGRHEWRYRRYYERWERFLPDFNLVAEHTVIIEEEIHPFPDEPDFGWKEDRHIVHALDILKAFEKKWDAPDWDLLYPITMRTKKALRKHPEPIFQKLPLPDLPTELLEQIMSSLGQSKARLLGSTCRLLREISLRFGIYEYRSLVLTCRPGPSPADDEKLNQLAHAAKVRLMNIMDELLARPDIMEKMLRFNAYDEWLSSSPLGERAGIVTRNEDIQFGFDINKEFYGPLYRKMAGFIRTGTNLVSLNLSCLLITPAIVRAIASLPRLHTVSMISCNFGDGLRTFPVLLPSSSSIIDLDITFPSVLWDNEIYWAFLTMCPRVRLLSVMGDSDHDFEIPSDPVLWRAYNPWSTVERLSIVHLCRFGTLYLARWIIEGKLRAPIRLTHVKVDSQWPINRNELFELIDALEGAPLKVLALCGIRYAGRDLIERIAEVFPELEGLTLIHRRKRDKSDEDRLAIWPHASWEYGPAFSGFHCLEHIGMNLYTPTITDYVDSGLMVRMENDEEDEDGRDEVYLSEDLDNETVVRVFATCCHTLKSFTFYNRMSLQPTYLISRRPDGAPVVKPEEGYPSLFRSIPGQYCPATSLLRTWPSFFPDQP